MDLFNFKNSPVLKLLSRAQKGQVGADDKLTPEQLASMRALVGTPEWRLYKRFIDVYISVKAQAMLAAADDAEVHRMRGYIQGLLHAAQIPEQIVEKDDYNARRAKRSDAASQQRSDSARASLYATGYSDRSL